MMQLGKIRKNTLGLVVEGMEAPLSMDHQLLNYTPRLSRLCVPGLVRVSTI